MVFGKNNLWNHYNEQQIVSSSDIHSEQHLPKARMCSRLSVDSLSQHLNDFQDHIKTWFLHMGTCAMSANYNIWLLPWLLLHCVYKPKEAQHAWWLLARTNVSMQLRVLHDSPLNVTHNQKHSLLLFCATHLFWPTVKKLVDFSYTNIAFGTTTATENKTQK